MNDPSAGHISAKLTTNNALLNAFPPSLFPMHSATAITRLFTLLFFGHWVTSVLGAICPQWSNLDTCQVAEQIRRAPACNFPRDVRSLNDGPTTEFQNGCLCSSVYYSFVMACGTCSGWNAWPFTQWHQNCYGSNIRNGSIDYTLPNGYPAWALLRYDRSNPTFSVSRAQAQIQAPRPPDTPAPPAPTRPVNTPKPEEPKPNPTPPTQPNVPNTTTRTPNTVISNAPSNPTSSPRTPDSEPDSNDPADPTNNEPDSSDTAGTGTNTNTASGSGSSSPSSSTGARPSSGSSSGSSDEEQDPNSPEFLNVPNPSDDPLGLQSNGGRATGKVNPSSGGSNDPTGASKSPNLGAIIGGIVAALFVTLAVAGAIYFFVLRRRRNRTAPSAAYMAQFGDSTGRVMSPFTDNPSEPRASSPTTRPRSRSSDLLEPVRPESPTLPRKSNDLRLAQAQNPFEIAEYNVNMRESTASRASMRQYTRSPTPLMGPRAR